MLVKLIIFLLCFTSSELIAQLTTIEEISAQIAAEPNAKNFTVLDIQVKTRRSQSFKTALLTNPDRFVIDFQQSILSPQAKFNVQGLSGVRTAPRNISDIRVVFDLPSKFIFNEQEQDNIKKEGDSYSKKWTLTSRFPVVDKTDQPQSTLASTNRAKTDKVDSAPADIVIVIDAGHGGKDPGAISPLQIKEKDIVLSVVKQIQYLFKSLPGFNIILTRDSNKYLTLVERRNIAQQSNSDMFISIHADAAVNQKAKGASVYIFTNGGASSESAKLLAQRENKRDQDPAHIGDYNLGKQDEDVDEVMVDFAASATLQRSRFLGEMVLMYLKKRTNLHKNSVEQANFAVLKNVDVPSLLIELGFLTNDFDAKNLGWRKYREELALQIFWAINAYLKQHAPSGTYASQFPGVLHYKVTEGDIIGSIAEEYGLKSKDIIKQSNLKNGDQLKVGQILSLPLK